jgi:deoxycytidylate deaminase
MSLNPDPFQGIYMGCSTGAMDSSIHKYRRILERDEEINAAKKWMEYAAKLAESSRCHRSKRAAVLVKNNIVVGQGVNGPMKGMPVCDPCMRYSLKVPSKTRYELCRGVHAEEAAIYDSLRKAARCPDPKDTGLHDVTPNFSILYHIRIERGGNAWMPGASGDPSCTLCARPILEWGVKEVVLWHGGNVFEAYDAETFYKLSLKNMVKASGLFREG